MALKLHIQGVYRDCKPKNGKTFTLDELQEIVGGYIQFLKFQTGVIMILNEEGKMLGFPMNREATRIAKENNLIFPEDYIVGTVLLVDPDEIE